MTSPSTLLLNNNEISTHIPHIQEELLKFLNKLHSLKKYNHYGVLQIFLAFLVSLNLLKSIIVTELNTSRQIF
jgi:hypothetical protein